MNLTNTQKAKIYCIKNEHAKYATNCMGYIYCGRCGEQIGDTLMGIFDLKEFAIVNHKCKLCDDIFKTLSDIDQLIF